jgi:hypothetical protein
MRKTPTLDDLARDVAAAAQGVVDEAHSGRDAIDSVRESTLGFIIGNVDHSQYRQVCAWIERLPATDRYPLITLIAEALLAQHQFDREAVNVVWERADLEAETPLDEHTRAAQARLIGGEDPRFAEQDSARQ